MGLNISKKLRFAREKLNLSQKEMAEKLNLQQPQYSLIERGKADFRMDKLQHLVDLGISPVWFISPKEEIVFDEKKAFDLDYRETISYEEILKDDNRTVSNPESISKNTAVDESEFISYLKNQIEELKEENSDLKIENKRLIEQNAYYRGLLDTNGISYKQTAS